MQVVGGEEIDDEDIYSQSSPRHSIIENDDLFMEPQAEKDDEAKRMTETEVEPPVHEEAPIRNPGNSSDPTPDERDRHYRTHLPYRAWCPVCVQSKAREDPHYKLTAEERQLGLPEVAMDYAEVKEYTSPNNADTGPLQLEDGDNGEETKDNVEDNGEEAKEDVEDDEDEDESNNKDDKKRRCHERKLIIGRDKWTKTTFAHIVKCKGLGDERVARKVTRSIDEVGHTRMTLKTDGEPATIDLQEEIIGSRTHETIPSNPPAYDPQANGVAERAVQEIKAQIRAVKIGLESRIKTQVSISWPVFEWIVPHASALVNRFLIGADGRTAHYRTFNKEFKGKVFEFGEQIWAKPMRSQRTRQKSSMDGRWIEGTYLGFEVRSNEHLVCLPEGGRSSE